MEKINNTKMVAEKVNAIFEEACLPIRVEAKEVWIDIGANWKDITLVVSNDDGEHFTHQTEPRCMEYAHNGKWRAAVIWLYDSFQRYERDWTCEESKRMSDVLCNHLIADRAAA